MYEYLKNLFEKNEDGTTKPMTADELEAAITKASDIKIVNLEDGEYISKEKHKKAIADKGEEIKALQKSLDEANEQIKSFEDMDVDKIKGEINEWKEKYEADTKALKEQREADRKAYAEDLLMSEYEFTSKAAKNGILAELRSKQFAIDDDGTLLGAKEFINKLMEDEEYKGAFKAEEQPETPPATPPAQPKPQFTTPSTGSAGAGGTGGQKMTLAEAMKYKNEHPDADIGSLI